MTVAAHALRVVRRLVWVTGIAGFPFVHGPLMRDMAHRAVGRRVSGFQMQFGAVGVARTARR